MVEKEREHIVDKINRLLQMNGDLLFWGLLIFLTFCLVMATIILGPR